MAFELKITADTAVELIASVDAFHDAIAGRKPSVAEPVAPAADETVADKPTRKPRAKADTSENGSMPADAKPALVADEPRREGVTDTASKVEATEPKIVDEGKALAIAEPTQEDKDQLLKEATQFSQKHGHDALLAALKAVGAERFSAIAFDKYPAFREAMAKTDGAASALS